MSYRKKHVRNKIYKIKSKHHTLKRLVFGISLLVIILFAFWHFIFYSGLQIKNIIISGNEKIKGADIQKFVFETIDKKFLDIGDFKLSSKNIFLIDKGNLEKKILKEFPIIKKLNIDKKLPQTLILGIEERKPIGVFCNGEECFLIDENGVIFEFLLVTPENVIMVRQALGDKNVFIGEEVIARNIMNAISKIKNSLKDNFQIDIKEALVSSPLKINIKTSENWEIYFDLDSDINLQIAKMSSLLKDEISAETRKTLQYIDLRFKDRAYYK